MSCESSRPGVEVGTDDLAADDPGSNPRGRRIIKGVSGSVSFPRVTGLAAWQRDNNGCVPVAWTASANLAVTPLTVG